MKQAKESGDQRSQASVNEAASAPVAASEGGGEASKATDAVTMLKQDHREVEQLFERYAATTRRADRARIARQVCNALTLHAILEEEIFYPACRELIDDDPLDEAQVEHDSAKILINELTLGTPEDPFYDAKFKVLAEQIKQHIQEEEGRPDSIFAKAVAAGADLVAIGEKLQARKSELTNKAGQGALHAELRSITNSANLSREKDMASYQRGRDYEDRGSRYRDEDDTSRRRDDHGRFLSDEDYGSRRGQERGYRGIPERDEYGRFMSDRDRGYGSSSRGRSSYDDEGYSSRGQRMPERDEQGRFMSDDESRGQGYSRGRDYERDDERDRRSARSSHHGGWFGDPEGHAEASRRGWDEREGERRSYRDEGRSYRDDERRGSSQGGGRRYEHRSRDDEQDERRGHSGWFGDPEGHSEASRRGWEHRR